MSRHRPLCLAATNRSGRCQNYRDTCPIKSHRTRSDKNHAPADPSGTQPLPALSVPQPRAKRDLFADKGLFGELAEKAVSEYQLARSQIVHDYYLIRYLHAWSQVSSDDHLQRAYSESSPSSQGQSLGRTVFAGGTSLSNAWGIAPRWSVDIDLMIDQSQEARSRHLKKACSAAALKAAASSGLMFQGSERSQNHFFFSVGGDSLPRSGLSVDIVFRAFESPVWVQKQPVMSLIGRVCDDDVLAEYPELGGFPFNTLGPGTTAMNKLLAQAEASDSGDAAQIAFRSRDLYDLACIANNRHSFEGHIGRDSKALLEIAERWSNRERPWDGFESIASFDPSTREHEALSAGYETVLNEMVWGEKIPLEEAVSLAVSLDPGPSEPKRTATGEPRVSHPRRQSHLL